MLLVADGVDPEQKGIQGQTPCTRAAANGHTAVVRILQSGSDYDVNV